MKLGFFISPSYFCHRELKGTSSKGTKEWCCNVGLNEEPGFPIHRSLMRKNFLYRKDMPTEMAMLPKTYSHIKRSMNTHCCEKATGNPEESSEQSTLQARGMQCSKRPSQQSPAGIVPSSVCCTRWDRKEFNQELHAGITLKTVLRDGVLQGLEG